MPPTRLTDTAISAALAGLPGWTLTDGKLDRAYVFADFVTAFGFMTQCALVAERMDHHPDWSNVYKRVDVSLSTHESGGITAKDVALATAMNRIAAPLLAPAAG